MHDIFETALTTGGDGVVASYVNFGVRMARSSLDVTNARDVLAVCRERRPRLIIHLAAETDLTRCEQDPQRAYLVNAIGAYHMAMAARDVAAKLIYVSTAGVFDGRKEGPYTEDDVANPQGPYGHSKYAGELLVSGILTDYCIVRAGWIFGGGPERDQKFVGKILRQLDKSDIKIIRGRYGSPTYAKDLVAGIKRLAAENKAGLYHMGNHGASTRFEVATEILRTAGKSARLVAVEQSEFPEFASSSRSAGNESMTSKVSYMRPWREALRDYIENEWQSVLSGSA